MAAAFFCGHTFGNDYRVIPENDQYAVIRVFGLTGIITAFMRQSINRVWGCVMEPNPMRKAVEGALRREFEEYFQKMSIITAQGSL